MPAIISMNAGFDHGPMASAPVSVRLRRAKDGHAMDLKQIDLNLLVVFHQLMVERSVSHAAEVLSVTQPAISNALRRLRKLLGDELFIRTPHGMEPTPLAQELAEPVAYALDVVKDALNRERSFDPRTAKRTFTLALTDIGEVYMLPRLAALLHESAPGIVVNTVRNSSDSLREQLERGQVDLAVGLLPDLAGGFFRQRLFRQGYVCAFRQGHPLATGKPVSIEEFTAAEHAVVLVAGTGHGEIDRLMRRKGIDRQVRVTVPHFIAVGHILASSDLVATLPERFVERICQPFGLASTRHPVKLPLHTIDLYWHAKVHKDPANQWMRRLIYDHFADH